jgi:hypothetical protein
LEAELPQRYQSYLKTRMKMALNDYALAAFYLHPCYENNRLPKEHKSRINKFLLINLNADGIEDLDNYNCNEGIFKTLNEKGVVKPLLFWRTAEVNHPNLAKLAVRLLLIPASSAQLERIFSAWSLIHTPIRTRLTFDKSKKLILVYYSLRVRDTELNLNSVDEEYED